MKYGYQSARSCHSVWMNRHGSRDISIKKINDALTRIHYRVEARHRAEQEAQAALERAAADDEQRTSCDLF